MFSSIRAVFLFILILSTFAPAIVNAASTSEGITFECRDANDQVQEDVVDGRTVKVCQIGDEVIVWGRLLDEWKADDTRKESLEKTVLALNGQLLVGINGRRTDKGLSFELIRKHGNVANMAAWKSVMTRAKLFEPKLMTIAIAVEGSTERYGEVEIGIKVASTLRLWGVGVLFVSLLAGFFFLVKRKDLLRDPGPKPSDGGKKPYSLGYTQMAVWFFAVLGGLLYVWLAAGDLAVLTPGVLGLLGISAATGLASTFVGSSKRTALPGELEKLDQEARTLNARLGELGAEIAIPPAPATLDVLKTEREQKTKRLAEIEARIKELTTIPSSRGFVSDILSSGGEVLLPRFQMMAWTLVLGMVFLHSVYTTLNMPEFDATLLALMGLSSGTYVGFKFPSPTGK